ncbi:MAG: hypothetical protein VB934_05785 [Polyangiaceae bacterium]
MSDDRLLSGFMNHDYVITFEIADEDARQAMTKLCEDDWDGDAITTTTWEISTELSPDQMETAVVTHLSEGDRAAYYYLTPPLGSGIPGVTDAKRIFRVVLS